MEFHVEREYGVEDGFLSWADEKAEENGSHTLLIFDTFKECFQFKIVGEQNVYAIEFSQIIPSGEEPNWDKIIEIMKDDDNKVMHIILSIAEKVNPDMHKEMIDNRTFTLVNRHEEDNADVAAATLGGTYH